MQLRYWMRARGAGPVMTQDQIRRHWTLIGDLHQEFVELAQAGEWSLESVAGAFAAIDRAVMSHRVGIVVAIHVIYRLWLHDRPVRECLEHHASELLKAADAPQLLNAVIEPRGRIDTFVVESAPDAPQ